MDDERRRHRRFPLKLSIFCQRVGHSGGKLYTGKSVNVSPSGMLVELRSEDLRDGDLISVEMTVPPTEGMLEFGGSISSYARVVRTRQDGSQSVFMPSSAKTIALEFCDSPKLRQ
jgi:hypothetical protein